ncbi:WXG100 protein secretion system (Wss), protein YukC [Bacillus sp. 491mf]|uniref:type VII secretion protein EssB/YukC n=1 Tax=Bacillus sp. 491mf TaxID=1761755 RepID=UPI0008E1A54E|nr:type VII secretion protein EssB/YukC [Bacillus sp. 491mf]SFD18533.1 WXG100 protein secretion system (Wss), protein YukC [Bacillus sp. 491mf]
MAKSQMFLEGTIEFEGRDATYRIPSLMTKIEQVAELARIKTEKSLFFHCKEIEMDNQYITFKYHVDEGFVPFMRTRKLGPLPKLALVEQLLEVQGLENSEFITFVVPENLYVSPSQEIKFLYQGISGLMNPMHEQHLYFYHTKCLIAYLYTKYSFQEIKQQGFGKVFEEASDFLTCVLEAKSYNDIQIAVTRERERLQESYVEKIEKKHSESALKKKWITIGATSLCAAGIFFGSFQLGSMLQKPNVAKAEQQLDQTEHLLSLYRYQYKHEYKKVIQSLSKAKNMSKEEKDLLYQAYMGAKDYQKAMQLTSAPEVLEELIKNKNTDAIAKLDSKEPAVQFEQANLKKDADKVITLQKNVKMDGRRLGMVAYAYFMKGDLGKAFELGKQAKNKDVMIAVKNKDIEKINNDGGKSPEQKAAEIAPIQADIEKIKKGEI